MLGMDRRKWTWMVNSRDPKECVLGQAYMEGSCTAFWCGEAMSCRTCYGAQAHLSSFQALLHISSVSHNYLNQKTTSDPRNHLNQKCSNM